MKFLPAALALGAAVALTGCGGGVKHLSEITPVRQQRLTGHWILNEKESMSPDSVFRRPAEGERGGARGGEPGEPGEGGEGGRGGGGFGGRGGFGGGGFGGRGGFGGGMEGRGGFGGRGGMSGGRPSGVRANPAVMQASRRMIMDREGVLDVVLTDSTADLSYPGEKPWVLFFGKTVKRKINDDVTIKAKAEWDNERLMVTRSISGGGSIQEIFEPALDARRLVVDVNVSMGGGGRGGREFQRVYYPEGAKSGDR